MRSRNKNSDLDAANTIINGLRNESIAFSQHLDTLTANFSTQMKKRLEECKQKILSSAGNKRVHVGVKPTDRTSIVRSPVYKKQKAATSGEIFDDSADFDTMVKKFKAMKKAELTTLLESRGLCSIGTKDVLINRLADDFLSICAETKQVYESEDPVTEDMMIDAISDDNFPSHEVEEQPQVMNRKDSMIMTKLVHGTDSMQISLSENRSPNVKQQGAMEKKPVSVLKQMFEPHIFKSVSKDSEMDVAKENSPTQRENCRTEPRSPIRTFKAVMNSALSVLSTEKIRAHSPIPKKSTNNECSARPLSPQVKPVSSPREPQQVVNGSIVKNPTYLGSSKIASISALSAAKTSYLQSGAARMAVNPDKQNEMREQSKSLSSKNTFVTPSQVHTTFSSLTTIDPDLKRRQKLAVIRAAAAEKNLKPGPVLDSYKAQRDLVSQSLAHSAVKVTRTDLVSPLAHSAVKLTGTPSSTFRSLLASPDASCEYEISDKEDTDSESESDGDQDNNTKHVPTWAGSQKLQEKLKKQLHPGGLDPDDIFGEVETCDLIAIFDNPRTRFKKRTSSGNWGKDRATMAEKLAYKRRMQYNSTGTIA